MTDPDRVKRCPCPEHEGPNPLSVSEFSRRKAGGLQSWCKTCTTRNQTRQDQTNRDIVFGHYGRICSCPGCGATKDLTIDHINGDGDAHRIGLFGRSAESRQLFIWLIETGFPPGFQVLCRPCNASKGTGPACRLDHTGTGLKYCSYPGHEGPNPLPFSGFNQNCRKRDGLQNECRACEARRRRARRYGHQQDQETNT